MDYNELYDLALKTAIRAHDGQKDKSGRSYIMHPIRVAERCQGMKAKIVALLHDCIEDTNVTPDYLHHLGFPEEIVNGVMSVTRGERESYEDFIKRAGKHPLGKEVKLADLADNLDVRRLKEITDADISRMRKYLKAWHYLTQL